MAEVAAQVQSLAKSPFLISKAGSIVFAWSAISFGDVPALGQLATSGAHIGGLKRDAARALMTIHSQAAVAFLAELLNSPDEEERRLAIGA